MRLLIQKNSNSEQIRLFVSTGCRKELFSILFSADPERKLANDGKKGEPISLLTDCISGNIALATGG